jgi:hypothetical protein
MAAPTNVTDFDIVLSREDHGWKASCTSGVGVIGEATRPTPTQALHGMARVINQYLHQSARQRPGPENVEPIAPPTPTSTDEG